MNEPLIEFSNFTFKYRAQKKPTLTDISLRIFKGEKILIAGPSGSGKSTLGSCLNGLIPFNNPGTITGELLIGGKKPESVFSLGVSVGTVLQDTDAQFVGLSSGEDIAFSLENLAVTQNEMKKRVQKAAKLVEASGYLTHSPQRLSGGQKQRVSMAGVLIDNAPILLFDEPLAALDPLTGKYATALIDEIARDTGCTIIIIEHRLEDVLWKHIDRVIVLDNGRIIADAPPDEIVVSEKLDKIGLRRPLYVTALERAGVSVMPGSNPGRIETLRLSNGDKEKLRLWAKAVTQPPFENASKSETSKNKEEPPEKEAQENTPLLDIKNVGFTYDETGTAALRDVSFKLYPGEMTAIVGANGAGKSTLAKLIVGFETESAGTICYNGEDMSDFTIPERAERIGYVMQNPNQMICKPMIFDEVALGLRVRGFPESEVAERVERVLDVCGLSRFVKWPISALSYGQKKRVTIADALVLNPQIIILDEPTAGQDYKHYTDIMEFLAQLNCRGVTVLLITHDMHLCLEYAKRAIVFSDGRLVADRQTYELLSDPALAKKASLRETSLYELARLCGIDDAKVLIKAYLSGFGADNTAGRGI
ncbi:MAG: DUF3744 domain-containing protein [Oscillospiraceae bacterium]|nr:DUF3744 domain-containing protein [Oscillospiraceae bacterium]